MYHIIYVLHDMFYKKVFFFSWCHVPWNVPIVMGHFLYRPAWTTTCHLHINQVCLLASKQMWIFIHHHWSMKVIKVFNVFFYILDVYWCLKKSTLSLIHTLLNLKSNYLDFNNPKLLTIHVTLFPDVKRIAMLLYN